MKHLVYLLQFALGLLPASHTKNWLMSRLGVDVSIAPSAKLAPSIYWKIEKLSVGERARVGIGNVFRDLRVLQVGVEATIGQLNWVTASAAIHEHPQGSLHHALVVDKLAALTSRHYVDCSGGVRIGAKSVVAGVRSTLMSHGPDIRANLQHAEPIEIGSACFIGSNVTVLSGCKLADRVIVAAGSVVVSNLSESNALYGGVPSRRLGDVAEARFFERERGPFDLPSE